MSLFFFKKEDCITGQIYIFPGERTRARPAKSSGVVSCSATSRIQRRNALPNVCMHFAPRKAAETRANLDDSVEGAARAARGRAFDPRPTVSNLGQIRGKSRGSRRCFASSCGNAWPMPQAGYGKCGCARPRPLALVAARDKRDTTPNGTMHACTDRTVHLACVSGRLRAMAGCPHCVCHPLGHNARPSGTHLARSIAWHAVCNCRPGARGFLAFWHETCSPPHVVFQKIPDLEFKNHSKAALAATGLAIRVAKKLGLGRAHWRGWRAVPGRKCLTVGWAACYHRSPMARKAAERKEVPQAEPVPIERFYNLATACEMVPFPSHSAMYNYLNTRGRDLPRRYRPSRRFRERMFTYSEIMEMRERTMFIMTPDEIKARWPGRPRGSHRPHGPLAAVIRRASGG